MQEVSRINVGQAPSKRYSVLRRNLVGVRAVGTVIVMLECFCTVSCSTSIGLDVSVKARCTYIHRGAGQ